MCDFIMNSILHSMSCCSFSMKRTSQEISTHVVVIWVMSSLTMGWVMTQAGIPKLPPKQHLGLVGWMILQPTAYATSGPGGSSNVPTHCPCIRGARGATPQYTAQATSGPWPGGFDNSPTHHPNNICAWCVRQLDQLTPNHWMGRVANFPNYYQNIIWARWVG